ncbi:hypothetical protein D3C75_739840 [compost metagenome]
MNLQVILILRTCKGGYTFIAATVTDHKTRRIVQAPVIVAVAYPCFADIAVNAAGFRRVFITR